MKTILCAVAFTCLLGSNTVFAQGTTVQVYPEEAWGTFSMNPNDGMFGTGSGDLNCTTAPLIKGASLIINWSKLEVDHDNDYRFDSNIGDRLQLFADCGWKCYIAIWVGGGDRIPDWIFDAPHNVPKVDVGGNYYPYYKNETYHELYWGMYKDLADYLFSLPDELRETVLFFQISEGSTGDEGLYHNDTPIDPQYDMTDKEYADFRRETWGEAGQWFVRKDDNGNVIKQIPICTNPTSTEDLIATINANQGPNVVVKEGSITHGFHAGNNASRVKSLREWRALTEEHGKTLWSRGEFNQYDDSDMGWLQLNRPQGIYWSALCGIHAGVNMWNLQYKGVMDNEGVKNTTAIEMYNKYGGTINPQTSTSAFSAFHRGLDAADIFTFPENIYGEAVDANGDQISDKTVALPARYNAILADFKDYGATIDDLDAAMKQWSPGSRRRTGRNDVGWKIVSGNYERHLSQIDPEQTSQAWWQVDETIYGRFARGFEPESGKDTMFFDLDDNFFGGPPLNGSENIQVQVIYRNSDAGSWELQYDAMDGTMKTALSVTNTGIGDWKTKTVILSDAFLGNRGSRGSDFMLVNTEGTNCRFHMITIEKNPALPKDPFGVILEGCQSGNLMENETHQLEAVVIPLDADNQSVTWTSSNDTVATVDANGVITTIAEGTATITVTTDNGGFADSCVVNVIANPCDNDLPWFDDDMIVNDNENFYYSSGAIDISCSSDENSIEGVSISLGLSSAGGLDDDDYLRIYYILDGGVRQTLAERNNSISSFTINELIGSGDSLEIIIESRNTYKDEYYYVDNISVKTVFIPEPAVELSGYPYYAITAGDTHQLKATITPVDTIEQTTAWSSSNTDVATVDNNGLVTTISEGSTIVSVSVNDGQLTDQCKIFVARAPILVTGVEISACTSEELEKGSTLQLSATISPADADDQAVIWSSSDTDIATVNFSGLVRALRGGSATITATTRDGGFISSCAITVETISVREVSLSGCTSEQLETGNTLQLAASLSPEDADDQSVRWSSSDTTVASVDQNGLVTAVSDGSSTITVATNDGDFTSNCEIAVATPAVAVTGVSLSGCAETTMKIDSTRQLTATVSPANAADQSVTWSSSNTAVASVDQSGLIDALSAGSSTITVTTVDGGFSDQCIVTVDSIDVSAIQFEGQWGAIKVYPNPVSDKLHLVLPESTSEKHIKIYDSIGQLLLAKKTSDTLLEVDVEDFKAEKFLFIQIQIGKISNSIKVIVTGK